VPTRPLPDGHAELVKRGAYMAEFVRQGLLEPDEALVLTVWPSARADAAITAHFAAVGGSGRRFRRYTQAQKDEAIRLVQGGASYLEAGRAVGAHRTRVRDWVRPRRPEKEAA
jgi:hypothetical protein